jgi:hypothetical protein
MLQWCPDGGTCRIETWNRRVAGPTVRWDQRLYSTALPVELSPWEGAGEAVIEDGKITFLQLVSDSTWEARWRAYEDARSRAEAHRLAGALAQVHATATSQAAIAARSTAEARQREPRPPDTQLRTMPSPVGWLGAAALTLLAAAGAALRRSR